MEPVEPKVLCVTKIVGVLLLLIFQIFVYFTPLKIIQYCMLCGSLVGKEMLLCVPEAAPELEVAGYAEAVLR